MGKTYTYTTNYSDQAQAIFTTRWTADGSGYSQGAYYDQIDGIWTKVYTEPETLANPATSFLTQQVNSARASIDSGRIISPDPVYINANGDSAVGAAFIEAVRYVVASGERTLAQADALLAKCYTTISPAQFMTGLPESFPASTQESFFMGQIIKANVFLQKTMGDIDDSALMAALPLGGSMPWSIAPGQSSVEAAIADWTGYSPVVFDGSGMAPISNNYLMDGLKAAVELDGGVLPDIATPFAVTNSTYVDSIQKVYIAFFNRPADAAGLNYWANFMENHNGDVTKLMEAFGPSAEYQSIYAGKTTDQLIEAVYNNLFARSAEPAGAAYWANGIDAGEITVANAAYTILRGALYEDYTMVVNKTAVARAFTESMNDSAKVAAYSNSDATAKARSFLNTVTDDPASVTAAKAVIMDTMKVVGISGSMSGDVITLNHAGRDVNIISFAPTQTLEATTIKGFSGGDTIDLSDFAFAGTMVGGVIKTGFQTGPDASYFGTKGVVLAESGGTTHVYVDANKDGGYTPGTDFDITITGVSAAAVNLVF